jgi:glucose/arabinose dehydrogenase
MPRSLLAVLLAALAPLMAAAACGDDDSAAPTETPTDAATAAPTKAATAAPTQAPTEATTAAATEAPTEATTEVPTEPATEPATEAAGERIEVEFAGGEVVGGLERVPVALGSEVTISVTADVADELHLHGYDLFVDLSPGVAGEITFVAEIPGVFEAELEAAGIPVVELEVG